MRGAILSGYFIVANGTSASQSRFFWSSAAHIVGKLKKVPLFPCNMRCGYLRWLNLAGLLLGAQGSAGGAAAQVAARGHGGSTERLPAPRLGGLGRAGVAPNRGAVSQGVQVSGCS